MAKNGPRLSGKSLEVLMAWFAASAIMFVEFKDGVQDCYPVWENVLLIEAEDGNAAFRLATDRAKEVEGDSRGSFRWDDRPARWVFAGIRKLLTVSHRHAGDELRSGDEVTFTEFLLNDRAALDRLVDGEGVALEYVSERQPL
jgi:hypothetical protein